MPSRAPDFFNTIRPFRPCGDLRRGPIADVAVDHAVGRGCARSQLSRRVSRAAVRQRLKSIRRRCRRLGTLASGRSAPWSCQSWYAPLPLLPARSREWQAIGPKQSFQKPSVSSRAIITPLRWDPMASDKNPHEEMWRGLLTDPQSPFMPIGCSSSCCRDLPGARRACSPWVACS